MIKILSDSTINKIAAGEVIEGPASVIKELVENSIDAGAGEIDIILEQAGKNLIIISDDGIGMSPEELKLAIKRHATSKLDEEDLLNIKTLGFRGEALPSIGSVSRTRITSKKKGSGSAYKISISGGQESNIEPAILNRGTKIEVRDLFFAIPPRLKFLRSDLSEFSSCRDIVKKIALARPEISFSLTHNGKNIFKVRGDSGNFSFENRIKDLLGESFVENSSRVDFARGGISVKGYTSLPTFNKASSSEQYLFVNGRPVKDKILSTALKVAYLDYIARDRHPAAILFVSLDPSSVDVNAHPAKTEVRFSDPESVKSLTIASVKKALASDSQKTSTTVSEKAIGFFSSEFLSRPAEENKFRENDKPSAGLYRIYSVPRSQKLMDTPPFPKIEIEDEPRSGVAEARGDRQYPLGVPKAQLLDTYLISEAPDGIIIVDQHAAHERIGYEKIKKALENKGIAGQRLLVPEIVEFSEEKYVRALTERKKELQETGLVLEPLGSSSVIVTETPSLLGEIDVKGLIEDLAHNFLELGEDIALTSLIESVTETYACRYSIRAGRKMSLPEAGELLRQMEETPFSGQCNHGRPTYVKLRLKDIEKLFGRA